MHGEFYKGRKKCKIERKESSSQNFTLENSASKRQITSALRVATVIVKKRDNHRQETFDITMTSVNTTTTAAQANSNWLLWFKSRDSAIQVNKQHQDTLIKTFDASIDPDTILGVVAKHEETVFLHKVNVGTSRIALFHHLTEVGGTVYDAGAKDYGFIQNVGEDSAIRMTPDPEGLSRVEVATAAPVPTVNQIFGITKVEDITSMTESATITYKP